MSRSQLTLRVQPDTRGRIDSMMAEFGFTDRGPFFDMLMAAYADGRLLVLDAPTKAALVGDAEEKMLAKARRAARETVYLVLFEEGYRAHPYDQ